MKMQRIMLVAAILGLFSCSDKDEKSIVDCISESLYIGAQHNISSQNSKTVNYSVSYSGSHQLDGSVKWNFGDGSAQQTVTGTTTSHTYAQAGTYTATATVTLNGGNCTHDVKETVTLQ
ncbi:PKD domain-containing protein [Sphingobacterium bambusae]|uniref:PKD domain-containing protein n=1 Tax=Sphingobacterium bambusae TaxID=662858 RepID=A0ABW6BJH1_9SPHI|nr:PKD domain-containing protein [Sphingobacterium bambusae]WPL49492.1 PKD domain-containing protein [Sphingobacterium bambusae]